MKLKFLGFILLVMFSCVGFADPSNGHGNFGPASGNTPPGLSGKGMPHGLSQGNKTPHGWSQGKKKGWHKHHGRYHHHHHNHHHHSNNND